MTFLGTEDTKRFPDRDHEGFITALRLSSSSLRFPVYCFGCLSQTMKRCLIVLRRLLIQHLCSYCPVWHMCTSPSFSITISQPGGCDPPCSSAPAALQDAWTTPEGSRGGGRGGGGGRKNIRHWKSSLNHRNSWCNSQPSSVVLLGSSPAWSRQEDAVWTVNTG